MSHGRQQMKIFQLFDILYDNLIHWFDQVSVLNLYFAARMMLSLGYIKETAIQGHFGSVVALSRKGEMWLENAKESSEEKLMATPNNELLHEENTSLVGMKIGVVGNSQPITPKQVSL